MKCNPKWLERPVDQGQIIRREWADAGEHGAVLQVTDRSDRSVSFYLHKWSTRRGAPSFEPWNNTLGVQRRSRRISEAEAERLLCAWNGR